MIVKNKFDNEGIYMAEALITREYIVERITDWEIRIGRLFNTIREWSVERPEWTLEERRITQRTEQLMREQEVDPRELPALNLFNRNFRVAFVPSALWIVGADGRINIVTNDNLYILVDRRENDNLPSDWQITTIPERPVTETFTREIFLRILDENR
jgi:hypothetical protein